MSKDDDAPGAPFMMRANIMRCEGPVTDEEMAANTETLSNSMLSLAERLAESMNREGVNYHALVISAAVSPDGVSFHDLGHNRKLSHREWLMIMLAACAQVRMAAGEDGDEPPAPDKSKMN